MRRLLLVLPVLTGLIASVGASATGSNNLPQMQQPMVRVGTAVVMGRVIDATTERAIPGARVEILGDPGIPSAVVLTDPDGRFAATELPAGRVRVFVTKDGYADGGPGQRWLGVAAIPYGFPNSVFVQYLTLRDGDRRGDLVIRLWKYGVITGHVTDDTGDPAVGVTVQAWPKVLAGGRSSFDSVETYSSQTDDRGVFRIPRVFPGDYVVAARAVTISVPASARLPDRGITKSNIEIVVARRSLGLSPDQGPAVDMPRAGATGTRSDGSWVSMPLGVPLSLPALDGSEGYATTLAPGVATAAEASVIGVAPGSEASASIQIRLQRLYSVSGRVVDESGIPRAIDLRMLNTDKMLVAVALSDEQGRFKFGGIPEGAYHIAALVFPEAPTRPQAVPGYHSAGHDLAPGFGTVAELDTAPMSNEPTEWTDEQIRVGHSESDVRVTLRTGARVTGHVVFAGRPTPTPAMLMTAKFTLERADGRSSLAEPRDPIATNERGDLRSIEFPAGRYLLRASRLPPEWTIQSAMVGEKNIEVTPLELGAQAVDNLVITVTKTPTVVTGQVRQSGGALDPNASVVAFSTDRSHWVDYGKRSLDIVPQRVTAEAQFTIRNLPAGEYYIVAVDDAALARGLDPEFLAALAGSADRVTVTNGESRTIDLTTRSISRTTDS